MFEFPANGAPPVREMPAAFGDGFPDNEIALADAFKRARKVLSEMKPDERDDFIDDVRWCLGLHDGAVSDRALFRAVDRAMSSVELPAKTMVTGADTAWKLIWGAVLINVAAAFGWTARPPVEGNAPGGDGAGGMMEAIGVVNVAAPANEHHELAEGRLAALFDHWPVFTTTAGRLATSIFVRGLEWGSLNLEFINRGSANLNVDQVATVIAVLRGVEALEMNEVLVKQLLPQGPKTKDQSFKTGWNRHITQPALESHLADHWTALTRDMKKQVRSHATRNVFSLINQTLVLEATDGTHPLVEVCGRLGGGSE